MRSKLFIKIITWTITIASIVTIHIFFELSYAKSLFIGVCFGCFQWALYRALTTRVRSSRKPDVEFVVIDMDEIIRDLKPDEAVIYTSDEDGELTCRFIRYLDFGFSCELEVMEGEKKGEKFLAFMNNVKRK